MRAARRQQPARDRARRFLAEQLAAGPLLVEYLRARATGRGMAWRTIQRAGSGVVLAQRVGFRPGHWVWTLESAINDAEESRPARKCPHCGGEIGDV